jgi:2-methylcitrate dehydratase PrpD
MAERGVQSPITIFEGEKGFVNATSDAWKKEMILEELGKKYLILDTYFKFHAACGLVHSSIDALLEIMNKNNVTPEDIKEIILKVQNYVAEVVGKHNIPETAEQAKFCLPYSAAVAVIEGSAGIEQYTEEKIKDPHILDMANRVRVIADSALDATFPKARSTVAKIITFTGKEHERRVDAARGHPEHPPSDEDLEKKYMSLASSHFNPNHARRVAETIKKLENLDDMEPFINLLRA